MDFRRDIERDLAACIVAQSLAVADWHVNEPETIDVAVFTDASEELMKRVLAQHLMNFRLWHVEDIARRKDVEPAVIATCKYRIDALNQQRNDAMEAVDACLVERLCNFLPASGGDRTRLNTESLGMAVDRLSILALKVFHMEEQACRHDVDESHRKACLGKLAVLKEQRADLTQAVFDLIEDFCTGIKRPKLYYQFKMYNDPTLNPELYGKK